MTANEESWDLDTDEIRSVDSEELYETRPNRWKGNKATWNTYTQEERLLHRSMEQLRNRDLSVHLYNAFALRNRAVRPSAAGEPNDADVDRPLEEIVDSGEWRPPNLWTAWPMNSRIVPGDDFLKETHDEDDDFTTRSRKEQLPSIPLEEEITATILRQAKERFLRRQRKAREREEASRTRDESANERTAASSMSAHSSAVSDGEDDDEDKDANAPPPSGQGVQTRLSDVEVEKPKRSKTYEPVVSANDDLSADLLRPSVRHILSTLDNTLTALHNSRLAGLSYMTDSSASATDVEDNNNASDAASVSSAASRASSSASKRKKKGRPRSKAPRTPEPEWTKALERRGRPKKVTVPLPGETEKEMKIRIARASKKRIPFSSDEEDAAAAETEGEDAVNKAEDSGNETSRSRSSRKKRDLPAEARAEAKMKARETMLGNWGLRDWSDVIGAASLSGFKPEVVARAAQRCADLFGQGMEMRTLLEGPAAKGPKPQTTRYIPGGGSSNRGGGAGGTAAPYAGPSSSEDSEEEKPVVKARRFGASSRQNRMARDSIPPSDSDATGRGRSTTAAAAVRRSRSVSRASSVGFFYCPVSGCERALEGFGRRANLQRHVATMHPGRAGDVPGGGGGGDRFDVESEDEMVGAVHVDGFLRPIRARKGWRAEDTGKRKRKRHYRGRKRDGSGSWSGVEEAVIDST
ncbi:hypothetical protein COL516b_012267 [Colletotrichum fioriniae]|nr:uncharacterized protein COL516b_012267 [Colletotrichum fioriniae]KAJ0295772.1 hypothetical protein COL516b_012267 [Colletotrichum fioriniae]